MNPTQDQLNNRLNPQSFDIANPTGDGLFRIQGDFGTQLFRKSGNNIENINLIDSMLSPAEKATYGDTGGQAREAINRLSKNYGIDYNSLNAFNAGDLSSQAQKLGLNTGQNGQFGNLYSGDVNNFLGSKNTAQSGVYNVNNTPNALNTTYNPSTWSPTGPVQKTGTSNFQSVNPEPLASANGQQVNQVNPNFSGVTTDGSYANNGQQMDLYGKLSNALNSLSSEVNKPNTAQSQPINLPSSNLQVGSSGSEVSALQNFLISKGFNIPDGATGYFGPQTKQALSDFQRANGINTEGNYGYYGPITRQAVSSGNINNGVGGVGASPSKTDVLNQAFVDRGLSINDTKASLNPLGAVKETIKQVLDTYNVSGITSQIKNISSDIENLNTSRNSEIQNIKDNPWTSQGTKDAEIEKITTKYDQKLNVKLNTLNTLQETYKTAADEARYMAGLVQNYYDKQQSLAQDQYQFETNNALKKAELAQTSELNAKKFAEDQRQFNMDYSIKKANLDLEKSKISPSNVSNDVNSLYNLTSNILSGDKGAFNSAFGFKSPANYFSGTDAQLIKNQVNQLKSNLSLENRQKLKGSGAISDFEARILERSASALDFNLSDSDARKQITQIRGAIGNSLGVPQKVNVSDPSSGITKSFTLSTSQINSAIKQGYNVEYSE